MGLLLLYSLPSMKRTAHIPLLYIIAILHWTELKKNCVGYASGIIKGKLDQGDQDSDGLKYSRVSKLSKLMEEFTELRTTIMAMIYYTKKILAKISQGKGIKRQQLRITQYDLPLGLSICCVDGDNTGKYTWCITNKGSSPQLWCPEFL